MPSIIKIAGVVAVLASVASALPAQPKFVRMQEKIFATTKRQAQTAAEQQLGLTDVDVLQL